jgi:hypothetical protein
MLRDGDLLRILFVGVNQPPTRPIGKCLAALVSRLVVPEFGLSKTTQPRPEAKSGAVLERKLKIRTTETRAQKRKESSWFF